VVAGQVQVSDPLGITTEEQDSQDDELGIANYPNPFNFATVIHISGDADSPMHLAVYDILGRLVRDLSAELNRHGTPSRVAWDGADQNGAALGSGVYFALLRTAHARVTHKILLLR
jgi:flagellar hook assembly protein FlgD